LSYDLTLISWTSWTTILSPAKSPSPGSGWGVAPDQLGAERDEQARGPSIWQHHAVSLDEMPVSKGDAERSGLRCEPAFTSALASTVRRSRPTPRAADVGIRGHACGIRLLGTSDVWRSARASIPELMLVIANPPAAKNTAITGPVGSTDLNAQNSTPGRWRNSTLIEASVGPRQADCMRSPNSFRIMAATTGTGSKAYARSMSGPRR
jgi:hypothetical protein